jgi:hypothetical protein
LYQSKRSGTNALQRPEPNQIVEEAMVATVATVMQGAVGNPAHQSFPQLVHLVLLPWAEARKDCVTVPKLRSVLEVHAVYWRAAAKSSICFKKPAQIALASFQMRKSAHALTAMDITGRVNHFVYVLANALAANVSNHTHMTVGKSTSPKATDTTKIALTVAVWTMRLHQLHLHRLEIHVNWLTATSLDMDIQTQGALTIPLEIACELTHTTQSVQKWILKWQKMANLATTIIR